MRQYQESNLYQAIQSRNVVTPEGVRPARIAFNNGVITSVGPCNDNSLDMGELYILPGLVDTHVHINEPGRTEWEGFETATRAAAAGGYTSVVDMPLNSIPATISTQALEEKRRCAQGKCLVDYAFWGGVVRGNSKDLELLAKAGVVGFKCFLVPSGVEEFEMVSEGDLHVAMPIIASTGLPLLVHAELPDSIADSSGKSWTQYADYLSSRPDDAELAAVNLMVRLCREFRCPVHIVHLASAVPLGLLAEARAEGLPITVETCPHYLFFAAEDIPDGATQYKCAPPIRNRQTRERLWKALATGEIDQIATDHSPCPPALKQPQTGNFAGAWGGIASLSLAISAVFTAGRTRGFGIEQLVRCMSTNPAKLAGFEARKGKIKSGWDADFVVFDPQEEFTVEANHLHFRHPVTPYLGQRLKGVVQQTFVRGECVYRKGQHWGSPRGLECRV